MGKALRMKVAASGLSAVLLLLSGALRADDAPDKALGFFLPDPEAASRWQPVIARLESDSFATREAASRELAELPALPAFVRQVAASERRPESRMRLGSLVAAFSKSNAASNAVSGGSAVRKFAFTPNQLARRQTRNEFVSRVASDNPVMKTMLDLVVPANSPFSVIEGEFSSKYGMSVNNLADSFAVLIETMRSVSKQEDDDGTRAQAQGLRNQIAGFLANDPAITSLNPQLKQSTSDTALLLALFVQAGYEVAKQGGASQKSGYADAIALMAQQSFGFDVRLLRLTDNGLEL